MAHSFSIILLFAGGVKYGKKSFMVVLAYYLDTLLHGSEGEKYALYDTDRDYPLEIKERLDSLDAASRRVCKRAI